MPGTVARLAGPAYIAASATDILAPAANVYALVRQIHISNKDTVSRTFTLYVGGSGGSAGGTEVSGLDHTIAAATEVDLYFPSGLKLVGGTDYLSGICSSASKVTVTVLGEKYAI